MAYGNLSHGQQLYLLSQNKLKSSFLCAQKGEGHLTMPQQGSSQPSPEKGAEAEPGRGGSARTPCLQGLLADFLCFDSTLRTAQVLFHLNLFQQPLISICSLMTSPDGLNKAVRSAALSEPTQKRRAVQRKERMSHRRYTARTKSSLPCI